MDQCRPFFGIEIKAIEPSIVALHIVVKHRVSSLELGCPVVVRQRDSCQCPLRDDDQKRADRFPTSSSYCPPFVIPAEAGTHSHGINGARGVSVCGTSGHMS